MDRTAKLPRDPPWTQHQPLPLPYFGLSGPAYNKLLEKYPKSCLPNQKCDYINNEPDWTVPFDVTALPWPSAKHRPTPGLASSPPYCHLGENQPIDACAKETQTQYDSNIYNY